MSTYTVFWASKHKTGKCTINDTKSKKSAIHAFHVAHKGIHIPVTAKVVAVVLKRKK